MNKPNVLLLADTAHPAQAVIDHIRAITSSDKIIWHILNPITFKIIDKIDFSIFDAIGIHYSIKPYNNYYLSDLLKKRIASFQGIKFLFLQDEYQKVNQVQEYMYTLGFHLLFTLVNCNIVNKAYPDPRLSGLKRVTVLTGYVQDYMKSIISLPVSERLIDVSYRSRRCEYWLGTLSHDKERIARGFTHYAQGKRLKLDISLEESARLYGEKWLQLLKNSKAVLGTESGASIWDFDDSIRKKTNRFLRKNKGANFDSVYEQVLKPFDGNILYNAISPRVFEAAATKTPMIMFPGEYSGICIPDKHYIPLEKNFSNIEEVIDKLKDFCFLQALADRTYNDLIVSDRYSQHKFSDLIANELLAIIKCRTKSINKIDLLSKIENTRKKYKNLNRFRCFCTEANFIFCNFFKLLFNPKYTFFTNVKLLAAGMKRYLSYLIPRLTRKRL
ncbi:hypothetical protein [Legionella nagasakiensis]|uniref:hypothetical protein n=1 Tax=Legionella nagasakiensis TaxID=535290 RepID=UPI001055F555|nr:hypothetical protein [Legionella nagasakiensis]